MNNKINILYRMLFLLCLLTACSGEINQDSTLLSDAFLCIDADCTIGVFTRPLTSNQAKVLLTDKYGTEKISHNYTEWRTSSGIGYLDYKDDVLIASSFYPEEKVFTMENLVSQFGEPSQVFVVRAFSLDYPCAGSFVIYPEQRLEVIFYPINNTVGIVPDQSIQNISFNFLEGYDYSLITDTWVVDWQGYQDYCEVVANPTATPDS